MNDDKWGEILDKVIAQFGVLEEGKEELNDPKGIREFVVFNGPMGKMMFERTTKPKVIDKRTFGAHKRTMGLGEEYIYSNTEQVKTFKAYKDVDGQWEPLEAEGML